MPAPRLILRPLGLATAAALLLSFSACQSTSESASSQSLTSHVGQYDAPGPGVGIVRVGVPVLEVGSDASRGLEKIAADQLATLLVRTDRFDVIERSQLEKLLAEQELEGIVAADEMAGMAQVRGVQYLMLGKVTNMRLKEVKTGAKSGLGKIANIAAGRFSGGIGVLDIDSEKIEIKAECGVDLRLVDPTTGSTLAASFGEFTRSDKASALGIQVLGVGADAEADLKISDDDRGLILRLALDDAVRKMLPSLDRKLRARAQEASAAQQ